MCALLRFSMSDSGNSRYAADTPSLKPYDAQSTLTSEAERLWKIVQASRQDVRYWVRVMRYNGNRYPHPLHECAVMVRDGLQELGYNAYFTEERVSPDSGWPTAEDRARRTRGERQIIIGGNVASDGDMLTIPNEAIVYNYEQVGGWTFQPAYAALLRRCTVWEYHPANIPRLYEQFGINATLVPFGYVPAFSPEIHTYQEPEYDVAFVGSLNPYRRHVINSLELMGLKVFVSDFCFGEARAQILRNCKLLLNVHFYPKVKLLEVVRLGIAMSACKAVVTQCDPDTKVDPYYLPGVATACYENLAPVCFELVRDTRRREQIAYEGYKLFTARRAADMLQKGLKDYVPPSLPQSYERSANPSGVVYRRIPRAGPIR